MGAIGGLVGIDGGAAGTGFGGPQQAKDLISPTNTNQINTAYGGTQDSLQGQQALLQALQNQNGLGNQSQVYNQLQGVANGTGPNPAQAMLNQTTGQNVANQAALMAGQRGAGSNVGLIARQAAQQGGSLQQNAAGQAATLQAQQSLNAINGAGNIANTQAANQVGQTNANTQSQMAEQQNLLGAAGNYNAQQVGMQSNINSTNAGLAEKTMGGQQALIGGALQGAAMAVMAGGGEVRKMADGGDASAFKGPQSRFGQFLSGASSAYDQVQGTSQPGEDAGQSALRNGASLLVKNSLSKNQPSSDGGLGAQIGSSDVGSSFQMPELGSGAGFYGGGSVGSRLKQGGHVPGSPSVGGAVNSYKNDNVKALLSPGEIVIPRSVSMSKDPVRGAAQFVAGVVAKRKAKGK